MADLTITNTQTLPSTGAKIAYAQCGEAIDVGEVVYINATDSKAWLADADTAAAAAAVGIALSTTVAANQYVAYQRDGTIIIGAAASVLQGQVYCVSTNAGKIAPEGDLTTGDYVTILGVGDASAGIALNIDVTGIAHV